MLGIYLIALIKSLFGKGLVRPLTLLKAIEHTCTIKNHSAKHQLLVIVIVVVVVIIVFPGLKTWKTFTKQDRKHKILSFQHNKPITIS
jgi:uncharacterized membrane protein YidH (DUF202 family)